MKNHLFWVPVVALAACLSAAWTGAVAQEPAAPASTPAGPHRVALIDMAYVFKNYSKFEALRADLKSEIEQSELKAKEMATQLQALQKEMKSFSEGSPEFTEREQQLAKQSAEFETYRRSQQREFLKKESQIYHNIYMEVGDSVRKYAEYYKYTLVLRFNREDLDTENPAQLIQGMNRQVVYYRGEDDITMSVLNHLNKKYTGGSAVAPAGAQATRPAATQQR